MKSLLSTRSARAIAGLLTLTPALGIYGSAQADSWRYSRSSRSHWTADGNLVDVQVLVDGQTSPLFFRPGTLDRHYFQAFQNRNYSILLRNNTGERVGVLLAVDGLNVVNGELSRQGANKPLYGVDPFESATIT